MVSYAATEVIAWHLFDDYGEDPLSKIASIIAFAGTTQCARDACVQLCARKLAHVAAHRELALYSELAQRDLMHLTCAPSNLAARVIFAIEPGLIDDDEFIEEMLIESITSGNLSVVQFIAHEIITIEPRIFWKLANYVMFREEFARLLFDPRILETCDCSRDFLNVCGVYQFLDELSFAASDEPCAQPHRGAMKCISDFCKNVIDRFCEIRPIVVNKLTSYAGQLSKFDCCDVLFMMLGVHGKRDMLILSVEQYFHHSRDAFAITRRFIDADPAIVDDEVKFAWARAYMRAVSFHGDDITDDIGCVLGIPHQDRARLLAHEYVISHLLTLGEYSRIIGNIASAIARCADEGHIILNYEFVRYVLKCARRVGTPSACKNAFSLCIVLGLIHRAAHDSACAIYRPGPW